MPGGPNSWFYTDASGNVTIVYDSNVDNDGWAPARDRFGITTENRNWTAIGDFLSELGGTDWSNADPAGAMAPQGNGVYKKTFTGVPAGGYQWKAVVTGTWDSVSWNERSEYTQNMAFAVTATTDTVNLWVDDWRGAVKVEVVSAPAVCRGDCNCDHAINWRDIDYFVAAMTSEMSWRNMFLPGSPSCTYANNDVNADGTVNWRDIDPFVAVMNTACP